MELTIIKNIAFKSEEFSEAPSRVKLTFTPDNYSALAKVQCLVSDNNLYSAKVDASDYCEEWMLVDEEGDEDINWRPEGVTFIVFEKRIYFYAQSKWDASDQIESDAIDLIPDVWNKFK